MALEVGFVNVQKDSEAKRKLFERRLADNQRTACRVTSAWVAGLSPYRYAIWRTNLDPVHVVFDGDDLAALGTASDDQWFVVFSRKLGRALSAKQSTKE